MSEAESKPALFDQDDLGTPLHGLDYPSLDVASEHFDDSMEAWVDLNLGCQEHTLIEINEKTLFVTVASLGVTSCAAYFAQRHGLLIGMDADTRKIIQSCSHPVLGYIGALSGTIIAEKQPRNRKIIAASIGALALNFGTESAQELVSSNGAFDYWNHASETIKDAFFASAGAGLFFWQNRKTKTE